MTPDTWHMTHDMWHMLGVNILSKFQLPSSYGLGLTVFWRYFGKRLTQWLNQSINYEAVYRTAPATPGLLILDGVGPVDNRPSTDELHHFVRKKEKMWHVTRDMWHVTHDMFGGVNILSKFQLPSSYCLWFMLLWRSGGKGWLTHWINQSVTEVIVEQPRLHKVC